MVKSELKIWEIDPETKDYLDENNFLQFGSMADITAGADDSSEENKIDYSITCIKKVNDNYRGFQIYKNDIEIGGIINKEKGREVFDFMKEEKHFFSNKFSRRFKGQLSIQINAKQIQEYIFDSVKIEKFHKCWTEKGENKYSLIMMVTSMSQNKYEMRELDED